LDIQWVNARHRIFKRRRGFTLIEASLTTVIIGVGVVAMMQLLASGTVNNIQAFEMTTGANVAKAIREVTVQKTMAQVLAMHNTYHEPPWDGRSQPIADLTGWRQTITVQAVNPDSLTTNIVNPTPDAVRVTVTVTHSGNRVCALSWYTFNATP
jgi:prepilin-type N-terminal cleavage/methylation domain-containing protein